MTLLQHYYTSCVKGTSGYAGFQVKALSPGLGQEDLKVLNSMVGYKIPPSLDANAISSHPIALRYTYVGRSKCFLVCSQSSGTDENGRPGNFFAHSIVTDTRDFEVLPPIMFWRHPFWKTSDPSDKLEIPPEPAFDLTPSLELEQIWPFLDSGNRRDWFHKLLCAVIQYDKTKRPIVILDEPDHIALWIAAVTFALPNVFRPFLSFSTYHHDPYQTPYRMNGTTRDSRFRFSLDEYAAYFVLNAEAQRISQAEPSRVADFIGKNMTPAAYDDQLLSFFAMCNKRLPPSGAGMGDKLELVANLFLAIRDRSLSLTDPAVQQGVQLLLKDLAARNSVEIEDLEDLDGAVDLLFQAECSAPGSALLADYCQALRLLQKWNPTFESRCPKDIELLIDLIAGGQVGLAEQFAGVCVEVYGHQALTHWASRPDLISSLAVRVSTANAQIHRLIWTQLAPLIEVGAQNRAILTDLVRAALAAIDRMPNADPLQPPRDAELLIEALQSATQTHPEFLWNITIAHRSHTSTSVLLWLYDMAVAKRSLTERKALRERLRAHEPGLVIHEFKRDTRAAGSQALSRQLEIWIKHLQDDPTTQGKLVSVGLELFWAALPGDQKQALAASLLGSDSIVPHIDDPWKAKLLTSYLASLDLRILDERVYPAYVKFYSYPGLNSTQRALIGGAIAMTTGRFSHGSIPEMSKLLTSLPEPHYRVEANKLIRRFFEKSISVDGHMEMLQATFVNRYADTFWDLYWGGFTKLMLDETRALDFVELLAFWFDESLSAFAGRQYLAPGFFLQLTDVLTAAKESKASARTFHVAAERIHAEAAKKPWYSLVEHLFVDKKRKRFFGIV